MKKNIFLFFSFTLFVLCVPIFSTDFPYTDATLRNNLERILQLKKDDVPMDKSNKNGAHAIHFAAYSGFTAIVKILVDFGAPLNGRTRSNRDFNLGKSLKHHQDRGGTTPLMLAAYAGQVVVVQTLLKLKADFDAQDKYKQTALHYAILAQPSWPHKPLDKAHQKVVKLLLEAGANPRLEDDHGQSAVDCYEPLAKLVETRAGYVSDEAVDLYRDELYCLMMQV